MEFHSPEDKAHSNTHYIALDGLRGLAILLVFFRHYGDLSSSSRLLHILNQVKNSGWIGVDLFFVLSGFLITGVLYDTRNAPNYFKNFYVRRALRLFPVFYGTAIVLLLLTPVLHLHWIAIQALYLVYGGNFVWIYDGSATTIGPFNLTHLWSLAVEEQFYFISNAFALDSRSNLIFKASDRYLRLFVSIAVCYGSIRNFGTCLLCPITSPHGWLRLWGDSRTTDSWNRS